MEPPPFGAGFRSQHFDEIVAARPAVDWLEVISDNYIGVGGPRRAMLERLRADYPLVLHGLSLSIAGSEPLREAYLQGLRALAESLEPAWVSDHLCWTALGGYESHDLLPVAHTGEVLDLVAGRVEHVQEVLRRPLVLENASAYVAFRGAEMDEAEFFTALCARTGCRMLLDVNNLHVNAANLGIDPLRYLAALRAPTVAYLHLAGHAVLADVLIDTHDAGVPAQVWDLFEAAVRRFPDAGVIIERDDNLPPFERLVEEVEIARRRHAAARATAVPIDRRAAEMKAAAGPGKPGSVPAAPWRQAQGEFWARLVAEPGGAEGDDLTALLDRGLPVRASRGMRVYGDAYAASLRRALAANFPALARVVSRDDFAQLTAAYLRHHPPCGYDFRALGAGLAAFVGQHRFTGDYGVEPGVLAEIAALEQAQLEVLDEVDEGPAVEGAALAAVAPEQWEDVRLVFVRAQRIVRARHDVLPVIEAVARGENPQRPAAMDGAYLVHRSGDGVRAERLSERQADVLDALVAGRPFGEACRSAGVDTEAGEMVMECARALITACSLGLVLEVKVGEKSQFGG
jgi:uncharacterized protein (UPF0276 family)